MKSDSILQEFLEAKGVEYAPFDPERAPRLSKKLNLSLRETQVIVEIIGTNGKGSTGRFLALLLKQLGFSVGHFTSPHLFCVNERFWKNGSLVEDSFLESSFLELDREVLEEASYFEILTFLAFKVFSDCAVVILEAGLGGEYDSTTTCASADLSLFTQIGIDHQEFLGDTLEEIVTTKLNAMTKEAILGFQNEKKVVRIAQEIAKKKKVSLKILSQIPKEVRQYVSLQKYPSYQEKNLALALEGLFSLKKILKMPSFTQESLLKFLPRLDLQGRMQCLNAHIYLDVAHNVDGAKALLESFRGSGFKQNKCVLVYNSFFDKNPREVLHTLKPIIKRVEIFNLDHPRLIKKEALEEILRDLGLEYSHFKQIQENEMYLVCGSFSVVAKFLEQFHEGKIKTNKAK